ncbi:MAG: NAD+ synthase [Methanobrevibacter sp.]|nr:NAD+ synthase [Methanobrevibacter sp.]
MKLPEINQKTAKKEIVNFIKEIKYKTSADGIVIGLSGGIDSTLVAYLLKEAIGSENIYSYHLATLTTPKEDTLHARLVAKLLDIEYKEINIDTISEEFLNLASDKSGNEFDSKSNNKFDSKSSNEFNKNNKNKIAEGNLKARIRMSLLYYFANLKNCLVAGTGNKSELLIGYFTKYGDGGCDFEPIGDMYKTQVKELAKSLNIPEEIIEKPPRAGLWENQIDEDEIGLTYEVLDQLLYLIVDKKLTDEAILNELNVFLSDINMVKDRITNNKHKLHSPPSPFKNEKLF